jgi:DNA (cytosine-5)-methyltransferase 1
VRTTLTHGSLFTGIGGFDLGFAYVGIPTRWLIEIDPYCRAVLKKNFPGVPLHADIRNVGEENLEKVDIVSGGFPCQPFSQAGKKQGTKDSRFLWPEMLRVVRELRPRWVVAENVHGLLSLDGGRTHHQICSELEAEGYEVRTLLLPACAFGAPQRRDRVWILAHTEGIDLRAWNAREDGREERDNASGEGAAIGRLPSWQAEPSVRRVANGVPYRLHRNKSLGNAVVPQIAAWIGAGIVRHEALSEHAKGEQD